MQNFDIYMQILQYHPYAQWENYKDKSELECLCILEYYKQKVKQERPTYQRKLVKTLKPKTRIGEYGQKQVLADNGSYEDYID